MYYSFTVIVVLFTHFQWLMHYCCYCPFFSSSFHAFPVTGVLLSLWSFFKFFLCLSTDWCVTVVTVLFFKSSFHAFPLMCYYHYCPFSSSFHVSTDWRANSGSSGSHWALVCPLRVRVSWEALWENAACAVGRRREDQDEVLSCFLFSHYRHTPPPPPPPPPPPQEDSSDTGHQVSCLESQGCCLVSLSPSLEFVFLP